MACFDAISAVQALGFISSNRLKRQADRTSRLLQPNLLLKPNPNLNPNLNLNPNPADKANLGWNNIAHVRSNCQTSTSDHPTGTGQLCKTKQEGSSRRGTEFHPQEDGRRRRFRRPQGVNLSVFWQLTRGLQLVRIIYKGKKIKHSADVRSCRQRLAFFNFKNVHSALGRGVHNDGQSQAATRKDDSRLAFLGWGVSAVIQSDTSA